MTENKDGWPETFDLVPHPIKRVAKVIGGLFCMHQLASHGDHFQHPLDTPLEPVTDWPGKPYTYPDLSVNQMVFEDE